MAVITPSRLQYDVLSAAVYDAPKLSNHISQCRRIMHISKKPMALVFSARLRRDFLRNSWRLIGSSSVFTSCREGFSKNCYSVIQSTSATSEVDLAVSKNSKDNEKKRTITVPRVLTIAGSDSGSGAGIQADIKTCAALGVYCTSAITALTAQNTHGVQGIMPVPEKFLQEQLQSILLDVGADTVKTGMLPNAGSVLTICKELRDHHRGKLVVDPVLVATSGDHLAASNVLEPLRQELLPMADLVTPNLAEAAAILGLQRGTIRTLATMREAAAAIHRLGPKYVLIKGGHLKDTKNAVDVLYDGQEWQEVSAQWVDTRNTHGTGCTLSSAIAAELAKGRPMLQAVQAAKVYLTDILARSSHVTIGSGPQAPLNHFPMLAPWGEASPREAFQPSDLLLYAVTDPRMNHHWGRSLAEAVQAAIEGGATFLQIREKDADTGDFLREAEAAVQVARAAGIPLVVNDRVDVALAVGADGVHIGQSDLPVAVARRLLGPHRIIGVSAKTVEQAQLAADGGADYLGVGGVYETQTKSGNLTIGLEGLRVVCESSPIPVVAIGGIKGHNAGDVLRVPASKLSGVAVVSALFDQPDIVAATHSLRSVIESAQAN